MFRIQKNSWKNMYLRLKIYFLKFLIWGELLYNIVIVFAIHQHESAIGIHRCLPLKPPPHLPHHPTLLGFHRELALRSLCCTANYHWLSTLHMVMYMFPCYFLKSSHLLSPPRWPNVCSLCLHVHCCPVDRIISRWTYQ